MRQERKSQESYNQESARESFTGFYPELFRTSFTSSSRAELRNRLTYQAIDQDNECLHFKNRSEQADVGPYLTAVLDALVPEESKARFITQATFPKVTSDSNYRFDEPSRTLPSAKEPLVMIQFKASKPPAEDEENTTPENPTLSELVTGYNGVEEVPEEEKIQSQKVQGLSLPYSRQNEIVAPNNPLADMVISLKRFERDNHVGRFNKISTPVNLDIVGIRTELDQSGPPNRQSYEVTSFIVHSGNFSVGHYYTYVKERVLDQDGNEIVVWAKYDDSSITEICLGHILPPEASAAYVLKLSPLSDDYQSKTGQDRYKNGLPRAQTCGTLNTGNTCWENAGFAFVASMWFPYIAEERKKAPVVSARNAPRRVAKTQGTAPSKTLIASDEEDLQRAINASLVTHLEELETHFKESDQALQSLLGAIIGTDYSSLSQDSVKANFQNTVATYFFSLAAKESGGNDDKYASIVRAFTPETSDDTSDANGGAFGFFTCTENPATTLPLLEYVVGRISTNIGRDTFTSAPAQFIENEVAHFYKRLESQRASLARDENSNPRKTLEVTPSAPQQTIISTTNAIDPQDQQESQTTTRLDSEPSPAPKPPIEVSTLGGRLVEITAANGAWKDAVGQERGRNNDYLLVGKSRNLQEHEVNLKTAEILRSLMTNSEVRKLNGGQNLSQSQVLEIIDVATNRGGIANKKNTQSDRPIYLKEAATFRDFNKTIAEDFEPDDGQQKYVPKPNINPKLAKVFSALFQERSQEEGILSGRKGGKAVGRRLTFTSDQDIEAFKNPTKFREAADRRPSALR
jgi:hypothetical protein